MMTTTSEQRDLIERFLAAHSRVEQHLREALRLSSQTPFSQLVARFQDATPGWQDGSRLRVYADLRNALVHERTKPYQYLSVPLPEVVNEIEHIEERLLRPERVMPRFQKSVVIISTGDTLLNVLRLVEKHQYSQFPVLSDGRLKALLTENGITRWFAHHASTETWPSVLDQTTVEQVLQEEEPRKNYAFVDREAPIYRVLGLFIEQRFLEAVLITHSGQPQQSLLGIITRWDVAALKV